MAPFVLSSDQGANLATQVQRPGKRNIDDFYTSDDDMVEDAEHMVGMDSRKGVAPFADLAY
jgi:hypothetical protein